MGAINGNAVTAFRRLRGWSGQDLARRLDITPGYLSRIESGGRKNPRPELIHTIAKTLGVSVTEITHPVDMATAA